jgi:hypothetical protein
MVWRDRNNARMHCTAGTPNNSLERRRRSGHKLTSWRRADSESARRHQIDSPRAPVAVGAPAPRSRSRYWFGTSSTRRFWARPSAVLLVATKSVFP